MICETLHLVFNDRKRHRFPFDKNLIPGNGIYILFEKGELGHGECDRIVRIGTHTGQNNLRQRLSEHFVKENKDRSIFRKNIGRALLNKRQDPFIHQWELDLTTSAARRQHADEIDFEKLLEIEKDVSEIIRESFTFCVFEVHDLVDRLRFEERLISTVNHCPVCRASMTWLGNYSLKYQIRDSGLWLVQGLNGRGMDERDLEILRKMIRKE